jgi:hypothetical protein
MASDVLANDRFREGLSARLLAHGEMVHHASRKPFSIAIFSNARWRGEFREGVNRDGARLFQLRGPLALILSVFTLSPPNFYRFGALGIFSHVRF